MAPHDPYRRQDAYDALVARIYDAALDPTRWTDVLESLAHYMGARSGMLRLVDIDRLQVVTNHHFGLDPAYQTRYQKYLVKLDPFIPAIPEHGPAGRLHTSAGLVAPAAFRKSEFYADYMQPQRIFNCIGGFLCGSETNVVYFGLQRSETDGSFLAADGERMAPVVEHMRRAYRIRHRLAGLEADLGARDETLDRLGMGVVLIDRSGRVVYTNASAESLFACGDSPLGLHGRALVGSTDIVHREVQRVLWLAYGAEERVHGALKLDAPSGKRLSLVTAPLSCSEHSIASSHPGAVAAVFLDYGRERKPSDLKLLSAIYGLTAAESKVALDLTHGMSVTDISERHGTTENTVRSQLKSAMHKTGTKRQAELVRLLSGLQQLNL